MVSRLPHKQEIASPTLAPATKQKKRAMGDISPGPSFHSVSIFAPYLKSFLPTNRTKMSSNIPVTTPRENTSNDSILCPLIF